MQGWRGEQRRHAMAARGIPTRLPPENMSFRRKLASRGKTGLYTTQFYEKFSEDIQEAFDSEWVQDDENAIGADMFELLMDVVSPGLGQSEEHTEAQRIKAERELRVIARDDELIGLVRWKETYPIEVGDEAYECIHINELFIVPMHRRTGMGREVVGDIFAENPEIEFVNGVALEQSHSFWQGLGAELGPEMGNTGRRPFTVWRHDFEAGKKGHYFEECIPPGLFR